MVDKLEAVEVTQADRDLRDQIIDLDWPGNHAVYEHELDQIIARHRLASATPANGEQVERAFRAGWEQACITVDPCNGFHEEDYAEARSEILAPLSTPTENARSRVKVLEEALRPFAAVAEHMSGRNGIVIGYDHTNVTYEHFRRARTALGNKETDRHG